MSITDIIIVSYNDAVPLKSCLMSILDNCKDYNIIIVDNNRTNRGYTKGVNYGIARGCGEYIWLLNSDAVVLPKAQDELIARIESMSEIAMASSMQLDPQSPDDQRYGGVANCGYPYGIHKSGKVSYHNNMTPKKEIWLNFASVMIKRSLYTKIGPLDERYYMYYSDSDYCYTARKAGYECWYEPESRVLHKLNSSSNSILVDIDKKEFEKKWISDSKSGWDQLSILP